MPTYTVEKSTWKKDWTGKQGQTIPIWELSLKDGEGFTTVEQFGGSQPQVGSSVEGTIEHSSFGFKFKPVQAPKSASNSAGGGYGKSPEERKSIERMAAQKAAIALLATEIQGGLTDLQGKSIFEVLKPRIQFFVDDLAQP